MSSLPAERSIWIGNNVATVAYGIDIYMVFHSLYLLRQLNTVTPRMKLVYIGWSLIQLLNFTVFVATNGITEEFMWIDHRDFPGGPMALFSALYRCYIIWNATWRILGLPFIGELVMGIFFIAESAHPNATFFLEQSTFFSVPWISLASALNIILTGLLIGKILYVSRRVPFSSDYTGVVAILVESAIPLSLGGFAFVISNSTGSVAANSLDSIMGALNILCPQAIIMRVAMGRAWTEKTMIEISTRIQFSERKTETSTVGVVINGDLSETTSTVV